SFLFHYLSSGSTCNFSLPRDRGSSHCGRPSKQQSSPEREEPSRQIHQTLAAFHELSSASTNEKEIRYALNAVRFVASSENTLFSPSNSRPGNDHGKRPGPQQWHRHGPWLLLFVVHQRRIVNHDVSFSGAISWELCDYMVWRQ